MDYKNIPTSQIEEDLKRACGNLTEVARQYTVNRKTLHKYIVSKPKLHNFLKELREEHGASYNPEFERGTKHEKDYHFNPVVKRFEWGKQGPDKPCANCGHGWVVHGKMAGEGRCLHVTCLRDKNTVTCTEFVTMTAEELEEYEKEVNTERKVA